MPVPAVNLVTSAALNKDECHKLKSSSPRLAFRPTEFKGPTVVRAPLIGNSFKNVFEDVAHAELVVIALEACEVKESNTMKFDQSSSVRQEICNLPQACPAPVLVRVTPP
jgi:hypothetical protein